MSIVIESVGATKYYGSRIALEDVTIAVEEGEVLCVVGASGSGKTTLLRCLALLEPLDRGQIRFRGVAVRNGRELLNGGKALRGALGFVPQDLALWPHLSVLENVALAMVEVKNSSRDDARSRALSLLNHFGLGDRRDESPEALSIGQRQRIAIARALALNPALLLLDEITSALDHELIEGILSLIARLASEGRTMVVVTHHLEFAHRVSKRILVMADGRVVREGPPGKILPGEPLVGHTLVAQE